MHFDCVAQQTSLSNTEKELSNIYSKAFSFIYESRDSLEYYNTLFENKMHDCILKNPKTLNYPFQILKDSSNCFIVTSSDGLFRKYTWIDWFNSTFTRYFSEVDQYKSGKKVLTKIPVKEEDDPGTFCSKIYTIPNAGKVYYLSIDNAMYSTKDVSQSIQVYTIDHDNLVDTVKLFKTKKQLLNKIYVQFDFFSVAKKRERPVDVISYDEKQKIIYIAVVNNKDAVTDKSILYQLKGRYFEYIGIEKGRRK